MDKFQQNLGLVYHLVNRYKPRHWEFDDFLNHGRWGLYKGIQSYDSTKKTKESTYYSRCILNELNMYLRRTKRHEKCIYIDQYTENQKNLIKELTSKTNTEKEVVKRDTLNRVMKILNKMKKQHRECIKLRYLEERKQMEVSKIMGVTQSYISKLEKKLLKKIKEAVS